MKLCLKCNKPKDESDFYKNKAKKDGIDIYCKECICAHVKRYREDNKEEIALRRKEYFLNHKKEKSDYDKEYYKRNEELKKIYAKKYRETNRDAVLKTISNWTKNNKGTGECRLYCSENCKKACPTYHQIKYEKGFKFATSREVPAEFRKIALEDRNYKCEKCDSIENGLHVHHIEGYTEQPMFMADLSNVIVVCKKCHKVIHKQKGCSYQDYQCSNKNKSLLYK